MGLTLDLGHPGWRSAPRLDPGGLPIVALGQAPLPSDVLPE
jgi:hypothetical protein